MIRVLMLMAMLPIAAKAAPPGEVVQALGNATLSGSAEVRFFGFNLYRADLWTSSDAYALSLTYKRGFSAKELSTASIKEIARMEDARTDLFAALEPKLRACFANVVAGDRITGVSMSADSALFFYNGQQRCSISYPSFRDRFFGIWLGPETRDPTSRDQLLGRN